MPRRQKIVISASSSETEEESDFAVLPSRNSKRRSQLSSSAGNVFLSSSSSSPASQSSDDDDKWPAQSVANNSASGRRISSRRISDSDSSDEVQILASFNHGVPSSFMSGSSPVVGLEAKSKRRRLNDAKETTKELKEAPLKSSLRKSRKSALGKLVEKKRRRKSGTLSSPLAIKYHDDSDQASINSYDDGSSDPFVDDGNLNRDDYVSDSDDLEVADPFQIDRIKAANTSPSKSRTRIISGSKKRLVHDSSDESEHAEVPDSDASSYGNPDTSDDEGDGFVQKNRDTRLAENWKSELPLHFSFHSNQSLSEVFTVFVQMLASEIISPGFIKSCYSDQDTYFLGSMKRIDDIVESKKMSVVSSSAWKPHFKHDLETYPHLKYYSVRADGDQCEACCRKNRIATYQLELDGPVYDRIDLNIFPKHKDNLKPGQKNRYMMGRFCMTRCYLYHRLHHYKFNLLESLREEIELIREQEGDGDNDEQVLISFMDKATYINTIFHEFKNLDEEIKGFTLD